jgi:hypothetical protein
VHLEYLFQAFDLMLGFRQMRFESLLQLRIGGLCDHLRQSGRDFLLGVIDVLQLMDEKIVKRCNIFREETHVQLLCFRARLTISLARCSRRSPINSCVTDDAGPSALKLGATSTLIFNEVFGFELLGPVPTPTPE